MPHPERASEAILGNDDGRWIFASLRRWLLEEPRRVA
jgi:phosphoribosylformylglycinamidine (FGAM) synthase-like amidotransferase family enzyme